MSDDWSLDRWTEDGPDEEDVPDDKLVCYVTGDVRDDTEHERNRQELAKELHQSYGYHPDDMGVEVPIKSGSGKIKADLAVFEKDADHFQHNIHIAIEIEPEDVDSDHRQHGISQAESYMRSAPAGLGIWYNGRQKRCLHLPDPSADLEDINDVPPQGLTLEDIEVPDFEQLRPARNLKQVFEECHDYIAGNQGLQKQQAFEEMLKVIFAKIRDEGPGKDINFYATRTERESNPSSCANRIENLFDEVKEANPEIFDPHEEIELDDGVLAYVVGKFQNVALTQTDQDIKGKAYEELVGSNLRGDRGEFFTPRMVCRAAIEIGFHVLEDKAWEDLRVLDPACGSGGFLVTVINYLSRQFYEQEMEKWGDEEKAKRNARDRLDTFTRDGLFGIDLNPTLVRSAKMNVLMHGGGGEENLHAANTLYPASWRPDIQEAIPDDSIDLIVTNPPFGADIPVTKEEILRQYDLAYTWDNGEKTTSLRSQRPPEVLFIERCIQLLKTGGVMVMVVPDNILSNPEHRNLRYWLLQQTQVVASIDLPGETFQPGTGTNAHLLAVQKKPPEKRSADQLDYDSFIAIAETVGKDNRGDPVRLRDEKGEPIYFEAEREVHTVSEGERITKQRTITEHPRDNDLPAIVRDFKQWWS
jgi:type I restriction enzyme M protein